MSQNSDDSNVVHQNFHAAVGNVAGRDINQNNVQNNVTSTQILHVLERAIERSNTIPELQKPGLLQQVRNLAGNPYISGLATSALYEGLKALFTQG
ncbi:MAG: hypothetical protein JO182_32355 [Acidobacteriaceae bacterium]|nr:hypothetical protein [Acidobacteriaceae bacterium]MBV9307207.1 hypothetical protein [Acidobacteriaceae bacterium]